MRKFLIVGCGGSGGRTLRLLIDQLQADLRSRLALDELPAAWQFVHVDVPVDPDFGPPPLGTVTDLGGSYLSFSSPTNSYQATSLNVESQLQNAHERNFAPLLGWAPRSRARANGVPVNAGAGQYRAVGRMLTLPRMIQLRETLVQAQARAVAPNAWGQIPAGETGSDLIIPIVIASMAGGSGASMFLDVCRVLGQLPGINPANLGCFVYTADVFAQLPEDVRANVEGNAMAAITEIIAAISGLSEEADRQTMQGMGIAVSASGTPPFRRVLPIGRRIGGSGAFFGDGSADGVYRGIARALAGVMTSEKASAQYLDSFIGNPTPLPMENDRFGWGISASDLPFGSMGFASLSLGRDRYMDYAVQRVARSAVTHLMSGHENSTSTLPSTEQLRLLMDNQWGLSLQAIGLPAVGEPTASWFQTVAYPRPQWEAAARESSASVATLVANVGEGRAVDWLRTAQAQAVSARMPTVAAVQRAAYAWAEGWAASLEGRTKSEFIRVAADFGVPYARDLMTRLSHHCDAVISDMAAAGLTCEAVDPVGGEPGLAQQAQALGRQVVGAQHALAQMYLRSVRSATENRVRREAARVGAEVLRSFAADVLTALEGAANDALRELEYEVDRPGGGAGLARLHSTVVADWPDESDRVPPRFDHAQNEVLLTTSQQFPAQFTADAAAIGDGLTYAEGLGRLRTEVIRGFWETAGAKADFTVLEQRGNWRAPALTRAAVDGQPTPQARPAYTVRFSPQDVINRSQRRLSASGDIFSKFAGQSIADYLNDRSVADIDRTRRQQELVGRFAEAMALARPVVGVDEQMVQRLHRAPLTYVYSFSELPFNANDTVATGILDRLKSDASLESSTVDNLRGAFAGSHSQTGKISIFGSYKKVSPLCYSSLLEPIQQRWASAPSGFQRDLWLWKRTRVLHASLAMSREEAIRLVAGWYIGRLLGLVRQENRLAPQVRSPRGWLIFGPMLQSEEAGFRTDFDILPTVLMSHVWALVRCAGDPSLAALEPYEALRWLADDSASGEMTPPVEELSGTQLLAQGLQGIELSLPPDGSSTTRRPLRGDPLSPILREALQAGATPAGAAWEPNQDHVVVEARHKAVMVWVNEMRAYLLETGYVKQGPRNDYTSMVDSVDALTTAPLIAEVAPLCMAALDLVEEMADAARTLAAAKETIPQAQNRSPYV